MKFCSRVACAENKHRQTVTIFKPNRYENGFQCTRNSSENQIIPPIIISFRNMSGSSHPKQPIIHNRVEKLQGNPCYGLLAIIIRYTSVQRWYRLHCSKAVLHCCLSQVMWSPLALSRNELHLDLNHSPSYPLMPFLLSCEDKSDNNLSQSFKTLQNPSISEEFWT